MKTKSKKSPEKHGMAGTRLYRIWHGMRRRCHNPKSHKWDLYGGRGIKVCQEWNSSFRAFMEWAIKNGYSDSLTIDRKESDGDYCPDNCRWATRREQAINARKNPKGKTSPFRGVMRHGNRWASRIGPANGKKLIGYFDNEIDAARAYDVVAKDMYGDFAKLNFPENSGREHGSSGESRCASPSPAVEQDASSTTVR